MTYENYVNGNSEGGDRSSQEIRDDLGKIRSEVDETLDALGAQLSPGQIIDRILNTFRGGGHGSSFIQNLAESARENPLPVMLVAAGLGLIARGQGEQRGHRREHKEHEYTTTARGRQLARRLHEGVTHGREQMGLKSEHARERFNDIAGRGRAAFHEQPLLVAALGLAFGAALGAVPTREKQGFMGEARERAGSRAREGAEGEANEAGAAVVSPTNDHK